MFKSLSRRQFLQASAFAAPALILPAKSQADLVEEDPILTGSLGDQPIKIESVELLENKGEYLVTVRCEQGVVGIGVANRKLKQTIEIFTKQIAPFFVGKDARDIESLLLQLYRHQSNYKWQGLAFWISVAAIEIAILDLIGIRTNRSIADLFGGQKQTQIELYVASPNRGNAPEAEVEYLKEVTSKVEARALKFRLGGRMSNNRETPAGRTEKLIPLVRQEFGGSYVLYGDANSSYNVENSIRIGRILEDNGYGFFEEPCPFDHLWETKQVADKLKLPVAGGEQEFSLRRFQWTIENRGVDIVQPDLHYFGGFLRSARVAKWAEQANLTCVPHMSGGGLGFLYVAQFASFLNNAGPFMEYKGEPQIPLECKTSDLQCRKGSMKVPSGPGFGITIAQDYLQHCQTIWRKTL